MDTPPAPVHLPPATPPVAPPAPGAEAEAGAAGAAGAARAVVHPMARSDRSLAPDVARGAMLLLIALANVNLHRFGYPVDDRLEEVGAPLVDRVTTAVEALLVADRSRPMFAILYGFGIAMIASRLAVRGVHPKGVRAVVRRRSLWLIALGSLHAVLLFTGDILGPYGATGLLAALLVHRSDRALRRWFWVALVVSEAAWTTIVVLGVGAMEPSGGVAPGFTYPEHMLAGLGAVALTAGSVLLMIFVAPVVLGIQLFRRGWLQRPEDHLPVLRRLFLGAVVVNLVANAPYALAVGEVWEPEGWMRFLVQEMHSLSGLFMGLGYVCGFALLAARWRGRRRGGVRLLAAVGERSLTAYLLQSVLMAPLLALWGLGLGGRIGASQAYLVAVATWVVIALAMLALDRAGRRGPFEVLLRRLTYGRPVLVEAGRPGGDVRA